ncbi:MAG: hypothetical protein CMO81_01235 [Waddliaceae bacterium]|nr:hypothetical protein [Waddliaceae bacterium]
MIAKVIVGSDLEQVRAEAENYFSKLENVLRRFSDSYNNHESRNYKNLYPKLQELQILLFQGWTNPSYELSDVLKVSPSLHGRVKSVMDLLDYSDFFIMPFLRKNKKIHALNTNLSVKSKIHQLRKDYFFSFNFGMKQQLTSDIHSLNSLRFRVDDFFLSKNSLLGVDRDVQYLAKNIFNNIGLIKQLLTDKKSSTQRLVYHFRQNLLDTAIFFDEKAYSVKKEYKGLLLEQARTCALLGTYLLDSNSDIVSNESSGELMKTNPLSITKKELCTQRKKVDKYLESIEIFVKKLSDQVLKYQEGDFSVLDSMIDRGEKIFHLSLEDHINLQDVLELSSCLLEKRHQIVNELMKIQEKIKKKNFFFPKEHQVSLEKLCENLFSLASVLDFGSGQESLETLIDELEDLLSRVDDHFYEYPWVENRKKFNKKIHQMTYRLWQNIPAFQLLLSESDEGRFIDRVHCFRRKLFQIARKIDLKQMNIPVERAQKYRYSIRALANLGIYLFPSANH